MSSVAEGGRIETAYTAELDGNDITGRQNLAGYATQRGYNCPDCGTHGSEPTHSAIHTGPYHAARLRNTPALVQARAAFDEAAAGFAVDFRDTPARPLWEHLGAVLAEVDKAAIGPEGEK